MSRTNRTWLDGQIWGVTFGNVEQRSNDMNTDENLRERLDFEYNVYGSYGGLSRHYGVSKGLIYKIIQFGHIPTKPEIRKNLNLPEKKTIEACIKCGRYHIQKRCSGGKYKKRNRLSINLDNPGSAARSIMKYMDLDLVEVLIEMLKEGKIDE